MRNEKYSILLSAVCYLPTCFLLLPVDFCVAQTANVRFSGIKLRETLTQYARTQRIGFLLDRRIDPGLLLEFEARNVSGLEMFTLLASQMELGFCRVGEIAYLGPKDAAVKLERVLFFERQSLSNRSLAARRVLTQKIRLKTEKLETPQEILQRLAQRMRTKIENLDHIPHDLWPELELPETNAYELLSLLLIGFDLTFEISDRGITFVPVPDNLPVVPETETGRSGAVQASKRPTTASPTLKDLRFQLEIKNKTVNEVLRSLADNLDLQLEIDEKVLQEKGITLEKRISFQRDQADIHALLQATLDPVECSYQLTGKRLSVLPKK